MAQMSDDEIRQHLRQLLSTTDLTQTTRKKIRKQLETDLNINLSSQHHKDFLKKEIAEFVKYKEREQNTSPNNDAPSHIDTNDRGSARSAPQQAEKQNDSMISNSSNNSNNNNDNNNNNNNNSGGGRKTSRPYDDNDDIDEPSRKRQRLSVNRSNDRDNRDRDRDRDRYNDRNNDRNNRNDRNNNNKNIRSRSRGDRSNSNKNNNDNDFDVFGDDDENDGPGFGIVDPDGRHSVIKKSDDGKSDSYYFKIPGSLKRVVMHKFRGKTYIGFREYYQKGNEEFPTKKGCNFSVDQWAEIRNVMPHIEAQLRQMDKRGSSGRRHY